MEKAKARTTAFIRLASTILLVECLFLKMSPFNASFLKNLFSYISKRENSGMGSKLLDYMIHRKMGFSWRPLLYHMDPWTVLQPKSGDCVRPERSTNKVGLQLKKASASPILPGNLSLEAKRRQNSNA